MAGLPLLIAASAALSTWFACITPFAAFGVIAATTLSRRNALGLTVAVWLANQAVGFGVLHYPWTGDSVAWGVAIGGAAVIGTLTAQWTIARLGSSRSPVQVLAAFVSSFALYELALYAVAVFSLGGTRAFAAPIVGLDSWTACGPLRSPRSKRLQRMRTRPGAVAGRASRVASTPSDGANRSSVVSKDTGRSGHYDPVLRVSTWKCGMAGFLLRGVPVVDCPVVRASPLLLCAWRRESRRHPAMLVCSAVRVFRGR